MQGRENIFEEEKERKKKKDVIVTFQRQNGKHLGANCHHA